MAIAFEAKVHLLKCSRDLACLLPAALPALTEPPFLLHVNPGWPGTHPRGLRTCCFFMGHSFPAPPAYALWLLWAAEPPSL